MSRPRVARTTAHRAAASVPPVWWQREPSTLIASIAVFALAIVAFANTFGHGFVWDDTILVDQKARFYRTWLDAWVEPAGLPNMRMYRPLEMMSLWIDQRLWSSSGGFHVTQVLLHAANGVLVLTLARALRATTWAALAAAAFFVLHPVQVESVAWLTCRADVLTGTFATIAMLALLRHQDAPAWWTIAIAAMASFLATASKETGSVTPLLLLAAVAVLPRPTADVRERLRRAWPVLVAAGVGVVLCQTLRPAAVTTGIGRAGLTWQDLVNLTGAFSYQLARVLVPFGFAPYVPTVPTDVAHLLLAAAGGIGLLGILAGPAHDGGIRRLGVLWFLLAVAPAVIVVLADFSATPVAERRLYLGMVGCALVVASVLTEYRGPATSWLGLGVIVTTLVALFTVTVQRNALWHDEVTLWSAVTERMDSEALPYLNLGLALADTGRPADAEAAYRRALARSPNDVTRQRTSINLGLILVDRDIDEAEALFTSANQVGPHAIAFRGLAMVARRRATTAARAGDRTTAVAELGRAMTAIDRALAINPRYYQGHLTRAGVLYDAGQYRAALAEYQRVVELAGESDAGRQAALNVRELVAWVAAHPEAP